MTGFLETLFRDTTAAVELRACENDYGGGAKSMMTSGANEEWKLFVRRHNRDGWGVYFGVCTRRIGSPTGKRGDLVECPAVWLDIDCRKLGVAGADAIRALDTCPLPPSIIVNSGNGLHAYWVLREPVDVAKVDCEAEQRLLAVMKQLVGVFAGDVKCCELARILRLPGTHNSKSVAKAANDGQAIECQVMSMADERRYELEEIEEWLERQRPLLTVAPELRAVAVPDDVFTAYAKKAGLHPPLDVSAALAAMALGGEGDSSIHQTQIKVSASLAARGHDDDAILDILLPATMKAAGPYAAAWNWRREEQNLRRMIATARTKFPAKPKPSLSQEAPQDSMAGGGEETRPAMVASMGANVTNISSARAKKETKTAADAAGGDANPGRSPTEAIARGVLAKIEGERGRLVTLGGNEMYLVERGRWRPFANNPVLEGFLDREINGMTRAFQKEPKPALMAGVKNMLRTMPEMHRGDIDLDTLEWIACNDASINVTTGEITDHSPDHMTTIGIDCDIKPARLGEGIARWQAFLAEAFSNLPDDKAAAMIATLQEIMGATLVRRKPRELLKAVILHGERGCGKTTVANVVRHLLGGSQRCAAISIKELGEKFGMQALVGKAAWVGDDAIGLGDKLDAERFKLIATNEDISISRKNLPDWEGKLNIAVLLTCNHTPRIIDTSNAVYSRLLIMPMRVGHDDEGNNSKEMNDALYAELAGILLWAIEGWQRLKARGRYDPPLLMHDAVGELREDNNPIGTFLVECTEVTDTTKVHKRDLLCAARGWFEDNYGRPQHGRELGPKTLARFIRDRLTIVGIEKRWFNGLKLNQDGLEMWERYRTHHSIQGASVTEALKASDVNRARKWDAPF